MVFIAYEPMGGTYSGYWDVVPGARPAVIEGTPGSRDAMVVVEWARERSPWVRVRAPDGRHYWAGDGPVPADFDGAWTAELAKALGNPIEKLRPEDMERSWLFRCADCGTCVSGDSEENAKAAFMQHWSATHAQP